LSAERLVWGKKTHKKTVAEKEGVNRKGGGDLRLSGGLPNRTGFGKSETLRGRAEQVQKRKTLEGNEKFFYGTGSRRMEHGKKIAGAFKKQVVIKKENADGPAMGGRNQYKPSEVRDREKLNEVSN